MKRIFTYALVFTLFSFSVQKTKKLNGIFELTVLSINSDTIFLKNHFKYTFDYISKTQFPNVLTTSDSTEIVKKANQAITNYDNLKINFIDESTLLMSKIRSGHGFYPNEFDTINYKISSDSLYLKNISRNNKESILLIDQNKTKLYTLDKVPSIEIYMEFYKVF